MHTLPFDHERQLSSVLVADSAGRPLLITKGAPEVVLDRCNNVPDLTRRVLDGLFAEGARVVAVATRPADGVEDLATAEHGLDLAGFLTFADRPKADAGSAIARLNQLGVAVKIITGDNGLVAAKVCIEIGVDCTGVLNGSEVEALDDDALEAAIPTTTVFARISPNHTMKYVLMATSSNFGNMFSAAGASVFLSFLPMLPSQILLNNLLYNAGQLVIPTDRVDPEALARPAAWDMRFIRRFMSVFGPVSSIFDFLTFWVMLSVLDAGHTEFRTGWFVESIATQTLVVYVIRTRRVPFFHSRPSLAMLCVPTTAALVGAILPYTGLAHLLGFTPLPTTFFLILFGMVLVYLLLVELAKTRFYRAPATPVSRRVPTHAQRLERRIRRRASRFSRHLPT